VKIRADAQDKFVDLLDISGIFFQKISDGFWELKTQNPYFTIA